MYVCYTHYYNWSAQSYYQLVWDYSNVIRLVSLITHFITKVSLMDKILLLCFMT